MDRLEHFNTIELSEELGGEINSMMERWEEDDDPEKGEYDRYAAFCEILKDSDDKNHWSSDFRTECKDVGIALGMFVPMSAEEITNTTVSGGRRAWDFKRKGVPYKFTNW